MEIFHHKTNKKIWVPLEDENGELLYPELEARLAKLPRYGDAIVMFEPELRGPKGIKSPPRLYSEPRAQHLVKDARERARLPFYITMEACRHGGMTLLGDAGLTEQEIMSLSAHVTAAAARIYVKKTARQRLNAAKKRRKYINGESNDSEGDGDVS